MTNENDTAEVIARKKLFASLIEKQFPERNVLDIMPEIKNISGNKAGKKLYNKFLDNDEKQGFSQSNKLLRKGFEPNKLLSSQIAYKFRLVMPKGLNPEQEFALQSIYLKSVVCGKEILAMKERKLPVAESNKKIFHLAKNLTLDFRKA